MKYMLINKTSGKMFRKAATREQARTIKRNHGFKHIITREVSGAMEVIR